MSADESKVEARRWLRFAQEDLEAAKALLGHADVPARISCYHAQQAAEKAIKAALIASRIEHPRHHNLDALRNLLPERWQVRRDVPDLAELTVWSIEARYPGDWPEATVDDARRAIELAESVTRSVARDLSASE